MRSQRLHAAMRESPYKATKAIHLKKIKIKTGVGDPRSHKLKKDFQPLCPLAAQRFLHVISVGVAWICFSNSDLFFSLSFTPQSSRQS